MCSCCWKGLPCCAVRQGRGRGGARNLYAALTIRQPDDSMKGKVYECSRVVMSSCCWQGLPFETRWTPPFIELAVVLGPFP